MKVLLTGAAGNLGFFTHQELIRQGVDVRATDICRRPDSPGPVRVADLLNREVCYELIEGVDAIISIANHPHQRAAISQRLFSENVTMNMNLFQAAAESRVKKLIYASSIQTITGSRTFAASASVTNLPYLPLDGEVPENAGNSYALSKCVGEMQLKYFVQSHRIASAVAVRLPMLYLPEWYEDLKARSLNKQVIIAPHSLMDEAFTWLGMPDAARLFTAIVKQDLPGYRCYLPAHPRPRINLSAAEVAQKYLQGAQLRVAPEQLSAIVDISRITAETGWTPQDNFWD